MDESLYITISPQQMQQHFKSILIKYGFEESKALECSEIFTSNSVDGVYTHGVNRFPRFIKYIQDGLVIPSAEPSLQNAFGGIEQWNGNIGPGVLNAVKATDRAMQLSQSNGIGCVALANTNHWMRGGYYGWRAAKAGYVFIGWTNTIGIMPAYNAIDSRLGNNPLVMALPYKEEAIVLDMAMSQFSYGAMEMAAMKNEKLSVYGGYDKEGNLTDDPSTILETRRPLPIGYWKGAGLSLLLDILAAILSGGLATNEISKQESEHALSQVFVAIDIGRLNNHSSIGAVIINIINDYHQSVPASESKHITYPGERVLATRQKNLKEGVPVLKTVWQQVMGL